MYIPAICFSPIIKCLHFDTIFTRHRYHINSVWTSSTKFCFPIKISGFETYLFNSHAFHTLRLTYLKSSFGMWPIVQLYKSKKKLIILQDIVAQKIGFGNCSRLAFPYVLAYYVLDITVSAGKKLIVFTHCSTNFN